MGAGAEVDKFLLEVGELVDDHPSLRRAGGQPLAQRLQDVRYGLALLPLTNRRWPRPRRPAQGGVVQRQVGVLRRGGGGQDAVTLRHLGGSSRVKSGRSLREHFWLGGITHLAWRGVGPS